MQLGFSVTFELYKYIWWSWVCFLEAFQDSNCQTIIEIRVSTDWSQAYGGTGLHAFWVEEVTSSGPTALLYLLTGPAYQIC